LLLRAGGDPASLAEEVRAAVRELDPGLPVFGLRTMEAHVGFATFQQRMAGTLLATLGGLALILAAIGIYGVLAYAVAQRTREIGIRVALGGRGRDIFALVVRQAMGLTAGGLAIGLAAALLVMPPLGKLLFLVSPTDLPTLGGVSLALGLVALAACWVPARRAVRLDPMVALRHE
jgi:putative ABC transport system permease protein